MHERLFTPGPTEVRAELLNELARPQLHHRTEEFVQLYDSIQDYLKRLLFTENPVLLFTSSSTGAMEAASPMVSKEMPESGQWCLWRPLA